MKSAMKAREGNKPKLTTSDCDWKSSEGEDTAMNIKRLNLEIY